MKRQSQAALQRWMLAGIFWLLGWSLIGCGVKGPPVPLQQPSLPSVVDLACDVSGRSATLAWSLAEPFSGKTVKDAAFGLYRFQRLIESESCEGCPQVFEKVKTIPFVDQESNRFVAQVPLDSGYRYVFKVRLETQNGVGPDSNLIRFDFSPDDATGGSTTP